MKRLNIVLATTVAIGSLAYGGGDILPPAIEHEEVYVPVEPATEIVQPVIAPQPQPVVVPEPQPVVVPTTPTPIPVPVKPITNIAPLGLYVALGLTAAQYEPSCGCKGKGDIDKTAGISGRVGYDFNQFVGVEARGIRTNWKSGGGKFKHYGAFLKPMYPISKNANIYGLAGIAKTKTAGGGRQLTDASGFAWGAGVEYDLGRDQAKEGRYSRTFDGYGDQEGGWGLFADYERLLQKSGSPDLDAVSAGITYDF